MRQIDYLKGNVVEKVIRDKEGRLVLASFFVYECAGRLRARLLEFSYLDERTLGGDILSISRHEKYKMEVSILASIPLASPYFSKNILLSYGSKPRAPTA